jgi:glutathionyl-hydroquinone reductase
MTSPEPLFGFKLIRELYWKSNPDYKGKFSVPVLWDTKTNTIVNNESAEIIVMLSTEFTAFEKHSKIDLYPLAMRKTIDEVSNSFLYGLNSGVYRCGQATTQAAYDEALADVTRTMTHVEGILAHSRYMCGQNLTLADVRLFPTIIRLDAAYYGHFKINNYTWDQYPSILGYMCELYQMPAIQATVDFDHIKFFYYSNTKINPNGIVPAGPSLKFLLESHGREQLQG